MSDNVPVRIRSRPKDKRGFPVPWFVAWRDGKPDFRMIDPPKFYQAIKERRCWICGEKLGRFMAFVIGPMCGVNRVSSEPPSHRECGIYAATHCPFLTTPAAKRSSRPMPDQSREPPGIHIDRNPGCCAVWVAEDYQVFKVENGHLIHIGEPVEILWFADGRQATRDEILESVETGLPSLEAVANEQGQESVEELAKQVEKFMPLVPA